MASSLDWATFFSGRYAVNVDGKYVHDVDITFTVRGNYCMKVSAKPVNVKGSASGFFHLVSAQCIDHRGDYRKTGPLQGGVMQCDYTGKADETGYFHIGFWEEPPSPPDRMVFGVWKGSLFVELPKKVKHSLIFSARNKKKRPDDNYPWNR